MDNVIKLQEKVSEVISNKSGHEGHVYKTNIRTFIHLFYNLCDDAAFSWTCWSIKFSVEQFFLHRLNGNTFCVYRQYTWYLKLLRFDSLVVV